MKYRNICTSAMLFAAGTLCAAVQFGVVRGENKWGYAGSHNTLLRPVPAAGKLELAVEFESAAGKETPIPRESWFGIYLEDTRQRTRYIWSLFNPGWDSAPQNLTPTLISYEKNGNMQRRAAADPVPANGRRRLALTLENGKLSLDCAVPGKPSRTILETAVPAGFAPDRAGITVDSYHARPVAPVRFDSFTLTADGRSERDDFTDAGNWETGSGRGLAAWPGASAPAAADGSLQKRLDAGERSLRLPAATYFVETLKVPGGTSLHFAPGSRLRILGSIELAGDDITIDGARFEYDRRKSGALVTAEGRSGLHFLNCSTAAWRGTGQDAVPPEKGAPVLFALTGCRDILVADGRFADLSHVLLARHCSRITVRGNRAERCRTLTNIADGSEFLNHTGNWSRNVVYQCMWWGGDSNDTKQGIAPGSARTVKRTAPGTPGFHRDTAGTYDISVQNNFAEHGTTLAWGSKGRNILISGNIARYMDDLAYDTEGGENVVISNNISVNSACAGIGCYFYGERVLIANNQVLVFEEGAEKQRGNFIRLHSAGKPDHFGNGQILVTGNQFIAETAAPRAVSIETAREIFLKGNTFRNGRIAAVNGHAERIVIAENDFETTAAQPKAAIELAGGIEHAIRGNRFRLRSGGGTAMKLGGNDVRIFLDGNLFLGYRTIFELSEKSAGTLFFTGNQYDGLPGSKADWRLIEQNNLYYGTEAR